MRSLLALGVLSLAYAQEDASVCSTISDAGVIGPVGCNYIPSGPFLDYFRSAVTIPNSVKQIDYDAFKFIQCTTIDADNLIGPAGCQEIQADVSFFGQYQEFEVKKPENVVVADGVFKVVPCTTIDGAGLVGPWNCEFVAANKFQRAVFATNITLPEHVNTIQNYAFADNTIDSVAMPGVRRIWPHAFANNALTAFTAPPNLWELLDYAFANNSLTSVVLPENYAQSIQKGTFENNALTSLSLPVGVGGIEQDAFKNNALTSAELPGVTRIAQDAFKDNALTSVFMPQVKEIMEGAFAGNQLVSVFMPNLENLHVDAFASNTREMTVYNVEDTDSVTSDRVTRSTLTSLVLPSGVIFRQSDNNDVMETVPVLAGLVSRDVARIGDENPWKVFLQSDSDVRDLRPTDTDHPLVRSQHDIPAPITFTFDEDRKGNRIVLADEVDGVGDYAFYGFELVSCALPSVDHIGEGAFWKVGLETVALPNVQDIHNIAFADNQLTSIALPNAVMIADAAFLNNHIATVVAPVARLIGASAFDLNPLTALTALTLPETAIIKHHAFGTLGKCTTIDADTKEIGPADCMFIPDNKFTEYSYFEVTMPASVITPPRNHLWGQQFKKVECTAISDAGLVGPSDCQFVADNKFSADSDTPVPATVTSVTLPPYVHTIGAYAFTGNNIESVAMPGVEQIRMNAFAGNALTSLSLPEGFSGSIPEGAFAGNQLTSLTLPVGVTEIVSDAFRNNTLTSVHLPGVEAIREGAFEHNALTSVVLPQVQILEAVSFKNNQLTSVFLPQLSVLLPTAFDNNEREIGVYNVNGATGEVESSSYATRSTLTSLVMPSGVKIPSADGLIDIDDTIAGLVSRDVARIGDEENPWKVFLQSDVRDLRVGEYVMGSPGPVVRSQYPIPQPITFTFDEERKGNTVVLADTVTEVGDYAFYGFELVSCALPNSVRRIGEGAFYRVGLETVALPGVAEIGAGAFAHNKLTSLLLPAGFNAPIPEWAFVDNALTSLSLPAGIQDIGARAFQDNHLTSLSLPAVTSIKRWAFAYNPLTSLDLPVVQDIRFGAFSGISTVSMDLFLVAPDTLVSIYPDAVSIVYSSDCSVGISEAVRNSDEHQALLAAGHNFDKPVFCQKFANAAAALASTSDGQGAMSDAWNAANLQCTA